MDLKLPGLPEIPKLPGIPKIALDRRQALMAAGAVVAVIVVAFAGWTLLLGYTDGQQVAVFGSHVAASEADLDRVNQAVSIHMRSPPDHRSIGEADAYMQEFDALADYGRRVTAYHRQILSADTVPIAYAGAQSAYIRALDHLNRAFSLWSSAAAAYDAKSHAAAKDALKSADEAWKEYAAAIEDYERELRAAEGG